MASGHASDGECSSTLSWEVLDSQSQDESPPVPVLPHLSGLHSLRRQQAFTESLVGTQTGASSRGLQINMPEPPEAAENDDSARTQFKFTDRSKHFHINHAHHHHYHHHYYTKTGRHSSVYNGYNGQGLNNGLRLQLVPAPKNPLRCRRPHAMQTLCCRILRLLGMDPLFFCWFSCNESSLV